MHYNIMCSVECILLYLLKRSFKIFPPLPFFFPDFFCYADIDGRRLVCNLNKRKKKASRINEIDILLKILMHIGETSISRYLNISTSQIFYNYFCLIFCAFLLFSCFIDEIFLELFFPFSRLKKSCPCSLLSYT